MNKPKSANGLLIECCHISLNILSKYYKFDLNEELNNYILEDDIEIDDHSGLTIFEEIPEENEFFIGVHFGKKIKEELLLSNSISLHNLTVIAEEMSHFKLITDSVLLHSNISELDIETLGEIDRFLCLMHWNNENCGLKIDKKWKNLHEICDSVFLGHRFKPGIKELYINAEALAFKHLKNAFADDWDVSNFNFNKINEKAKKYLSNYRKALLSF